jgi:hypothetical protein
MDEVHVQTVNGRPELREPVQRALGGPPVEGALPGGEQVLEVAEVGAVIPGSPGQLVGPPGAGDARPEVIEGRVADGDDERFDANLLRHY